MITTHLHRTVISLVLLLFSSFSVVSQTEQTHFVLDIERLKLPDHEEYFPQYFSLQYLTGYQLDSKKRLNLWTDVMLEYTDLGLLSLDDGNVVWEDLGDGDPDKMALTIFNLFDYSSNSICLGLPSIKMKISGIPNGTFFGNYNDFWNLTNSSNLTFHSSFFSMDYYSANAGLGIAEIELFNDTNGDWTNAVVSKYNNGNYVEPRFYYEEIIIDWDCRCLYIECSQGQAESAVGASDGIIELDISKGFPENETPNYSVSWTGPQNGSVLITAEGIAQIENLPAGNYEIIVNSGYGDPSICAVKIDSPPCNPSISLAFADPGCNASVDGMAQIAITGLSNPLIIEWEGPFNLPDQLDQFNLSSGNYSVKITGDKGCSVDTFFTLTDPSALLLNCQENAPISFYNGDDGIVGLSFTNGNSPYTVDYSGSKNGTEIFNSASGTISNLVAGDYELKVTDANGCIDSCMITLESFECTMLVMASPINPTCSQNLDGSITLEITGANLPLQITWYQYGNEISAAEDLLNVEIGQYKVEVLDATQCFFTDSFVLDAITPTIQLTYTDPICNGGTDGSVGINYNGLTTPVSVVWDAPTALDDQLTHSNLSAGDYAVTITGLNGCSVDTFFTLTDPPALEMSCSIESHISTVNGNEGVVSISFANNSSPYTISYLGPVSGTEIFNASSGLISNLVAGEYTFEVADAGGCLDSCNITINPFVCDLLVVGNPSYPTCHDQENGSIDLQVSTSNQPITVSWFYEGILIDSVEDISGLAVGKYTLLVVDAGLCQLTDSFVLVAPNIDITLEVQEITCNDANDGGAIISYTGLVEPVSISWTGNGVLDNELMQKELDEGHYSVTLEDANGCMIDTSFQLIDPPIFSIDCNQLDVESALGEEDGRLQIIFSGGIPPYNVQAFGPWNTTGTTSNSSIILGRMIAGTYDILVTDANGCLRICEATVESFDCKMVVTPTAVDPACMSGTNGKINLNISNATSPLNIIWYYQGNLISREPMVSHLVSGAYRAIVTDDNNCKFDSTFMLKDPIPFSIECEPITSASAFGREGKSLVSIEGGSGPFTITYDGPQRGQYTFEELSTELNNLSVGSYIVDVSDINGCKSSCQFTILRMNCSLSVNEELVHPICNNEYGSILINAIGLAPYNFNWTGINFLSNEKNLDSLFPGVYNLTVTDGNGCQFADSYVIEEPNLPLSLECAVVQHETAYKLSDGKVVLERLNGVGPFVIELNGPESLIFIDSFLNDPIILDSLEPGEYHVLIRDANFCEANCFFMIDSADFVCEMNLNFIVIPPSCANVKDGSISFEISNSIGLTKITWQGNPISGYSIDSLLAGNYILEIEDEMGCKISELVSIDDPEPLRIDVMIIDAQDVNTPNGQILTSINGGMRPYNLQWSNGETGLLIDSLSSGEYWVEVVDANGCSSHRNFTVGLLQSPCAALTIQAVLRDATCLNSEDGSIRVIPNGGQEPYIYNWSTGDSINRITDLIAGEYILVIEDQYGCTITETYTVNASDVAITSIDTQLCPGATLLFSDRFVSEPGTYYDTISIQSGCDSIVKLELSVDEILVDSIMFTQPNSCNPFGSISYGLSNAEYELSVDEGQNWFIQQINNLEVGSYPLWIKSNYCETILPNITIFIEEIKPELNLILQEPSSCTSSDGILTILTSELFEYNLNEQGWTSISDYNDLAPGQYQLSYRTSYADCQILFDTTFSLFAVNQEISVKIDSLFVPLCPEDSTGYLSISVDPYGEYQYLWSNGDTESFLSSMVPGNYEVIITKDECYHTALVELPFSDNAQTAVLQDTYFICAGVGQNLELDSNYGYIWNGPGNFFDIGPNVHLVAEGQYLLQILDGSGCILMDTTQISYTTTIFDANFLSPSATKVGEPFILVENSWPIPDSVQWFVESDSILQMNISANRLELMSNYTGLYKVSMKAFLNECYVEVVKWINIVEELEDQLDPSGLRSEIISFIIIPNPSTGIFNADVKLDSPQTVQLRLYNVDGNIIDVKKLEGQAEYLVNYSYPNLPPGIYSLALQTSNEWVTIGLVIQ